MSEYTIQRVREFIDDTGEDRQYNDCDVAEALYWYLQWNYCGQGDARYAAINALGIKPSRYSNEPEDAAREIYDELVDGGF